MTDGVDNALPDVFGDGSQTSFDQLLLMVRDSDAIVFPSTWILKRKYSSARARRAPRMQWHEISWDNWRRPPAVGFIELTS